MRRVWYYGSSFVSNSHVYIVDVYSLNFAFALYKINSNATVCIRVRRSSDNAELDIGFVGNDLDVLSLMSFIGSDDAFITVWYNQGLAGSVYDLDQPSGGFQPLIALGGGIYTAFGKISIYLVDKFFNVNPDLFNNKSYGASICALWNNSIGVRRDVFSFRSSSVGVRFFSSFNFNASNSLQLVTRRLDSDGGIFLNSPVNNINDMIRTDIVDWANRSAFIRQNGVEVAQSLTHGTSGNTSATDSSVARLGKNDNNILAVNRVSVWVLANSDISIDIPNIENDINNYYEIY